MESGSAFIFGEKGELVLYQPDRQLKGADARTVWELAYANEASTLETGRSFRVVMGWWITRAIGHKTGSLNMDEPLSQLEEEDWVECRPVGNPPSDVRGEIDEWSLRELLSVNGGVPIYPHRQEDDPRTELGFRQQFFAVVDRLVDIHGIRAGTPTIPNLGSMSLPHMRTHYPHAGEILHFEESLIGQIRDLSVKQSPDRTEKHLRDLVGIPIKAARGLMKLAARQAREFALTDIEDKRALLEARLYDYTDRCKEIMDLNNEMKAMKMLAGIQGLGAAPKNEDDDLISVIAKVSKARETSPLIRLEPGNDPEDDEDDDLNDAYRDE